MSDEKGTWIPKEVFDQEERARFLESQRKMLNDYNDAMRDMEQYFKREKEKAKKRDNDAS